MVVWQTSVGVSHVRRVLDPLLAKAVQARVRAAQIWREQHKVYAPHCERAWKEGKARVLPHLQGALAVAQQVWERSVEKAGPRVRQVRQAAEEYHAQLEGVVRGLVEKHGRGWKPEAGVVWYLAATLLALPLLLLAIAFVPFGR